MALILDGTNGLSDVDGSAATPAIRGSDANTGIFFPAADTIAFAEGGTEVARFNADAQFVAAAGTAALPVITTTGDLNTGIFFPGADRIGFAEGGVQVGEFDASGNFQFNSGYGSVATAFGCRAWVNFDGTTSPGTIRASGNVSSVTNNGTGDFTVNFITAMPDANYATAGMGKNTTAQEIVTRHATVAPTTTAFRLRTQNTSTFSSGDFVCVSFFR